MKSLSKYLNEKLIVCHQQIDEKLIVNKDYKDPNDELNKIISDYYAYRAIKRFFREVPSYLSIYVTLASQINHYNFEYYNTKQKVNVRNKIAEFEHCKEIYQTYINDYSEEMFNTMREKEIELEQLADDGFSIEFGNTKDFLLLVFGTDTNYWVFVGKK